MRQTVDGLAEGVQHFGGRMLTRKIIELGFLENDARDRTAKVTREHWETDIFTPEGHRSLRARVTETEMEHNLQWPPTAKRDAPRCAHALEFNTI